MAGGWYDICNIMRGARFYTWGVPVRFGGGGCVVVEWGFCFGLGGYCYKLVISRWG